MIFRRPRTTQPQSPVRIDPGSGVRPEFVILGGQQIELATGRPWTQAGGSSTIRRGWRAFDPAATANALTRAGTTTAAQTKCTFVVVMDRTAANAFAEIMGMSSNGTSFSLGCDGGGVTFGMRKNGVFDFTGLSPNSTAPIVLVCSHDQTTGDYWSFSRDLLTGEELSATQNDTSVSSASNGTVSINRNGGANAFGGYIYFGLGTFQYFTQQWGRRYLRNPWALIQPLGPRRWAPAAGIAFDSASNSGYKTATNTATWSHTCTGSDRYLAVNVERLSTPGTTVSSITYNGASLTQIGSASSGTDVGRVEAWGLAAPASGANNIVVTLSAAVAWAGTAVSYTGVHQTSPTEGWNSATAVNVGAADATVNITTVADNCWVIAACATDDASITASQTSRNNVTGAAGSGADEDSGPKTPAGSVTMTYTGVAALATWVIGGYAIRPVAASSLSGFLARFYYELIGKHMGP